MAVYYSDLITPSSANTTLDSQHRAPVGLSHARTRTSVASITAMPLTTDVVRMITLKSGDRLLKLELSSDGGSTAGAVNVGLYLAGDAHDGAVVDADLFASAQTISSALDLTDVFDEAATLAGVDRGKTLWELAAIGAGSDTEDPFVQYDITIVPSTTFTVADSELTLVATYMAGD